MFGVPSIEERIKKAQHNVERYQVCLNKAMSRVGELSLLKDVRDGKLLVLDLESAEPARIAFL